MKIKQIILIIITGLSPIWLTYFLPFIFMPDLLKMRENNTDGLLLYAMMWFIGTPLTFIIGLVNSYIVQKKPNAQQLTLIGYMIPAAIFCGIFVFQTY